VPTFRSKRLYCTTRECPGEGNPNRNLAFRIELWTSRPRIFISHEFEVEPKSHFPTVCNPACPACCDPALPTHITSHRTETIRSSRTSSTSCPRLSLKSPRNLKPSCDLSITIQGSIFWSPLRLMTSRAGFFPATRLERRPSGIGGPCCIAFAFAKSEFKQGLMIRNIVTQGPEDYCQGNT
jgi:hypothetical protein